MKNKLRVIPLLAVLVGCAAIQATTASAGLLENQLTSNSVTSYVAVTYNVQYCASVAANKYKITGVEYRWSRSTTTRKVSSARINFGEHGTRCGNIFENLANGVVQFTPCWNCGNSTSRYWTKSYIWHPSWPYVGYPSAPAGTQSVGAYAKSTIATSGGTVLSNICVQAYLVGGGPC